MEDNLLHLDGVSFSARIQRTPAMGKIRVVDGTAFLCQDVISGSSCGPERFGFKYSWSIQSGSTKHLEANSVTDLKLLMDEKDMLRETLRAGMLLGLGDLRMNILFCMGELVIGEYIYPEGNVATPNLLKTSLISDGWRIVRE